MNGSAVGKALKAVLAVQLVIGVLLVLGDMRGSATSFLPSFSPARQPLTEPVQPGDQRRKFNPTRNLPNLDPVRTAPEMPNRLGLTQVDGGLWRLEGSIASGDAERIKQMISDLEDQPETLILQSPGGSVQDALALGRFLRNSGIDTQMLRGEFCYSACPYLFAGGTNRQIETGASLGVHQHYFGESTLLPAFVAVEDIQRGQAMVMVYLSDMGIDPLVMQHALATPPDEIYVLVADEIEKYGFTTDNS